MKKLIPLLLSLLLLSACAAPEPAGPVEDDPPADSSTTQVANPWQEFTDAEELEAFTGFAFDVPDEVQDVGAITAYRAMEETAETVLVSNPPIHTGQMQTIYLAEVQYENGLTLRKRPGDGDISGDMNEYAETHTAATLDESGTVEMMGNDGHIHKAIWEMGGYTYAATSEDGLPVHVMAQLVMQIQ